MAAETTTKKGRERGTEKARKETSPENSRKGGRRKRESGNKAEEKRKTEEKGKRRKGTKLGKVQFQIFAGNFFSL